MQRTRSATRRRNEVTPIEVSGPAAFRVMRANQFRSRARRRWDMLRGVVRRMNILQFWLASVAGWVNGNPNLGMHYGPECADEYLLRQTAT